MTYDEMMASAKAVMGPKCRVCPDCNGLACKGEIPGVGGIGSGNSFTVSRDYLKGIKILMDVFYEPAEVDTSLTLFGQTFEIPFFVAPIGGMAMNYGSSMGEGEYADYVVRGMLDAGGFAFTPDGPNEALYYEPLEVVKEVGGRAVPTAKPWEGPILMQRLRDAEAAGAMAVACDVDSCGNINLKNAGKAVFPLSQANMTEIVQAIGIPFIPKGVMTPEAALRCAEAGCYGIVVSNHGGRVIEDSPAPCAMVPAIREAVGDRLKIFVDGGVRSGRDVFKCLALGADAVLIGRPYTIAAHGAGREGIRIYTEKILAELKDTMLMTGCTCLEDINQDKIWMVK